MTETRILADDGRYELPELNVDLLDKTLDHIHTLEAFREEGVEIGDRWNQGNWALQEECGTACCFAGWAVKLAGHRLVTTGECTCGCGSYSNELVVELPDGTTERVAEVAKRELGFAGDEIELFNSGNLLEDLDRIVGQIKAGELR